MTAALKQEIQMKIQMNVVKGPHAGQSFLFYKTPLTIGRGPENDIVLVNDPLVSRTHAKIDLVQNSFEISNLSDKNALLVHAESVTKSALVNDSSFQVGDSEFSFQFDLGKSVVSVPQTPPAVKQTVQAQVLSLKRPIVPKTTASAPSVKSNVVAPARPAAPAPSKVQPNSSAQMHYRPTANVAAAKTPVMFYAIIGIILCVAAYFYLQPAKVKAAKAKPVLKYEDEIAVKLESAKEKELRKKRDEDKLNRNSPQYLRAEENFIKGMRDFQLGNYARAQDFFQVVLNLNPSHQLARSYLRLSLVRFDELMQAKLMLGESYYQKHNFSMCESMFKQVMDMLQGRANDQKFKLAQRMAEKCQLAAEGIR